jgi:hypothetical protein
MPNRLIIKEHFMRNVSIKTAVLKLLTILLKSTRKIKHGSYMQKLPTSTVYRVPFTVNTKKRCKKVHKYTVVIKMNVIIQV